MGPERSEISVDLNRLFSAAKTIHEFCINRVLSLVKLGKHATIIQQTEQIGMLNENKSHQNLQSEAGIAFMD